MRTNIYSTIVAKRNECAMSVVDRPKNPVGATLQSVGQVVGEADGGDEKRVKTPIVKEWIGTVNNPRGGFSDALKFCLTDLVEKGSVVYAAAAFEVGDEKKTPHWHFAIKFAKQVSRRQVAKLVPPLESAFLDPRTQYATWSQSVDYFKFTGGVPVPGKENSTFWELGIFPTPVEARAVGGKKGGAKFKEGFEAAIELAKQGKIWEIEPGLLVKYLGTWQKMYGMAYRPSARGSLTDLWITGPPGSGKSKYVRDYCAQEGLALYVKIPSSKWWDNYMGEDVVLVDDVDHSMTPFRSQMVTLSDHYPFPVEVKGGTMMIRPKKVFYTSNFRISQIWPDSRDEAAIIRRVTEVSIAHGGGLCSADDEVAQWRCPPELKRSKSVFMPPNQQQAIQEGLLGARDTVEDGVCFVSATPVADDDETEEEA